MYDAKYMNRAIELAKIAASEDEVPVGAVIVKDGEVVAQAYNRKEHANCAVRHAEIEALEKACISVGNWYLEGCELYCTLEPCPMCAGAMINSRIDALYFGAYDQKAGCAGSVCNLLEHGKFNHDIEVQGGFMADECAEVLSAYFKSKRKNKSDND